MTSTSGGEGVGRGGRNDGQLIGWVVAGWPGMNVSPEESRDFDLWGGGGRKGGTQRRAINRLGGGKVIRNECFARGVP